MRGARSRTSLAVDAQKRREPGSTPAEEGTTLSTNGHATKRSDAEELLEIGAPGTAGGVVPTSARRQRARATTGWRNSGEATSGEATPAKTNKHVGGASSAASGEPTVLRACGRGQTGAASATSSQRRVEGCVHRGRSRRGQVCVEREGSRRRDVGPSRPSDATSLGSIGVARATGRSRLRARRAGGRSTGGARHGFHPFHESGPPDTREVLARASCERFALAMIRARICGPESGTEPASGGGHDRPRARASKTSPNARSRSSASAAMARRAWQRRPQELRRRATRSTSSTPRPTASATHLRPPPRKGRRGRRRRSTSRPAQTAKPSTMPPRSALRRVGSSRAPSRPRRSALRGPRHRGVHGERILMFAEPTNRFHRAHRWAREVGWPPRARPTTRRAFERKLSTKCPRRPDARRRGPATEDDNVLLPRRGALRPIDDVGRPGSGRS